MKRLLWSVSITAILFGTVALPSYALSLACCTSLEEMEQSSDLIVRGRPLADFDEVQKLYFSQAEYQARVTAGEPLPIGASVVIHDGNWQLVERYTTIPVEILEVIEGETDERVLGVVQHDDWGAIPMKKGAEYLLFLQQPSRSEEAGDIYYNFYGQGTYNIDGTDLRTSSAGYYDAEAVEERYGDRVQFVSSLSKQSTRAVQQEEEEPQMSLFHKWISAIRQWFKTD